MQKNTTTLFKYTLLLCLSFTAGLNYGFAQCAYVKKEKGVEVRISIPCDFPTRITDEASLKESLNIWRINNPTLKDLDLLPKSFPDDRFIEIPISIFNALSDEKKKNIKAISYFYKIKS